MIFYPVEKVFVGRYPQALKSHMTLWGKARKRGKGIYLFGNTRKRRKTVQFSVWIAVYTLMLVEQQA